jgi:hypothetical protein
MDIIRWGLGCTAMRISEEYIYRQPQVFIQGWLHTCNVFLCYILSTLCLYKTFLYILLVSDVFKFFLTKVIFVY